MDVSKLIRDPDVLRKAVKEVNNALYAVKPIKIYLPVRFSERGLASIGMETYIVGIFAIVADDTHYAVSMANAMMKIEPTSTANVVIDDTDYFEFYFEPGSVIVPSLDLVKRDTLTYQIYDEIISKGNVPWYLGYLDLGGLFDSAVYHAGANVGRNREVSELIASLISRDEKDRRIYYRQSVKSLEEVTKRPPVYVGMRSVIYAATNTLNKIAGSYMQDGLISALVSPSDREERIEAILRK